MSTKAKNYLIIGMIVFIVTGAFFGGKAVTRFKADIDALKTQNMGLQSKIIERDILIDAENTKVKQRNKTIDSLMVIYRAQEKTITGLTKERDEALLQLNGISADSSYDFLTTIAYVFPGIPTFLFNAGQVHAIHSDYLNARGAEKIIPALTDQLYNTKLQITNYEGLAKNLQTTIGLQRQNLTDCATQVANGDKIAKDLQKTINRERFRKALWRIGTGVGTGLAIAAALLI